MLLLAACTYNFELLRRQPRSYAVTTAATWASMIYVARTDSGVIVVDLGWMGAEEKLAHALRHVGATPGDVVAVFLTHSHRDHIAAWPSVRGARFYLGQPEVDLFLGRARHRGPLTRLTERLKATRLPRPGEVTVIGFSKDTAAIFGGDTVRAYLLPGHTAGSAAYVVRRTLFVGDAANKWPLSGFRGARWEYSDDVEQSRASMRSLWQRLTGVPVEILCTAHAKCARFDQRLREAIAR
jgi:glyoxylase-like metal-dependent hydrolase (beta-lactamase superfamily II)